MALRFCESFDHYLTTAEAARKWTVSSITGLGTGFARPGSPGFGGGGGTGGAERLRMILDAQPTWIIGWWTACTGIANGWNMVRLVDASGNEQCSVRIDSSGRPTISRNGNLLATATNPLLPNIWYHLEVKITVHNTAGEFELRINGTPVIGPTGSQNTRAQATNDASGFGFANPNGTTTSWDDIVVMDATGSYANDFIGPSQITIMRPDAAGNSTQWTPASYADNFANVNDAWADDDKTFNQDATAGHVDLYGMTNVPSGTIVGVQTVFTARQDAGGGRSIAPMWRIGSTDYQGTTKSLAASYVAYTEAYSVSPATGVPWTQSELNGAEMGVKLVS